MLEQDNFQQERLLNQPNNNQRITNIRLQKQIQFLKKSKLKYTLEHIDGDVRSAQESQNQSQIGNLRVQNSLSSQINHLRQSKKYSLNDISHKITIFESQILEKQLIIFIPKHYPFEQPLFYYQQQRLNEPSNQQSHLNDMKSSSKSPLSQSQIQQNLRTQLQKSQKISELMIWIPKYKILQLVQLIAIKIRQKKTQQKIIQNYALSQIFTFLNNPTVLCMLAILLRVLVGLGSYSGKNDWPNLGDFQAHRNWMSVTVNRPIEEWYEEPKQNIWWRIDYPPVAAYLSYILGSIYKHIEPQAMSLQRGFQSVMLQTFMRMSVLITQVVFVFPAVYLLCSKSSSDKFTIVKPFLLMTLFGCLLKPDIILIDHGHFQYNSLILGLILSAFYLLINKNYYICCIFYTVAIHSKQMSVYYALAFFAGLIGKVIGDYRTNKAKIMAELLKFATIVLSVSLIIWLPFILTGSAHLVIEAIFPVHRGLYQLKVQNFWCISDTIMKWQTKLSKQFLMVICFVTSTILSIPSMVTMIVQANKKNLSIGFFTISMTFFMFSYHVHEKSILLPLLIAPFLTEYLGPTFTFNLVLSGTIGMYHLLKQDGQWLQYFVLMIFYVIFMESYCKITCQLKQYVLQPYRTKRHSQKLHQRIFSSDSESTRFRLVKYSLYFVIVILHLAQILIPRPEKLQYLYHLLFAFYSFCFNGYSLVICNGILIENLYGNLVRKQRQTKAN